MFLIGAIIVLSVRTRDLTNQLDALTSSVQLLNNDVNSNFSTEKVVVDPVGAQVFIPELRIKLPLNETTKTIAYGMRTDQNGALLSEADVTSTNYIAPPMMTVMNCSNLVRLKIEPEPNPYSPHEIPSSVTLSDGRTLQVYKSSNIPSCMASWQNSVSPESMAQQFTNATSY